MRIHTLLVLAPLALVLALANGCGGKKAPVEPTVPTEVSEAGSDMPSLDSGSSMASSSSGSSMEAGSSETMTHPSDSVADAGAPMKDAGGAADAGKKPGGKPKPTAKPGPKKP